MSDWRENLVEDEREISRIVREARRIAVLGIKTEAQAAQPAFSVPRYMQNQGVDVIPIPVYYPEAKEILGRPVYRKVADVPGDIDILNVFRRPNDIPPHVDDILAKRPKCVWFQLGIRNEEAAERLARAGIRVIQDRCLKIDHMHYAR